MPSIKQVLRRYALPVAALLLGAYTIGASLWELGKTALYVHNATVLNGVVTDVRQRPFESQTEALEHGNLCAADATAYQPFVTFTLPAGITINKAMPDLDCDDYTLHQSVEIITHPHDPNQAHVYKGKFLYGWSLMKLAGGIVLFLPAVLILRKRRTGKRTHQKANTGTHAAQPSKKSPRREASLKPAEEDEFTLEAPVPTPTKKRRSPRKQSTSAGEKKEPSKRKKAGSSSTGSTRRRKSEPKE